MAITCLKNFIRKRKTIKFLENRRKIYCAVRLGYIILSLVARCKMQKSAAKKFGRSVSRKYIQILLPDFKFGSNTLSEGERQRIPIARALLKDAPIIIIGLSFRRRPFFPAFSGGSSAAEIIRRHLVWRLIVIPALAPASTAARAPVPQTSRRPLWKRRTLQSRKPRRSAGSCQRRGYS